MAKDDTDRVVDFMGDSGSQLADRGKTLTTQQLILHCLHLLVGSAQSVVLTSQLCPIRSQALCHIIKGLSQGADFITTLHFDASFQLSAGQGVGAIGQVGNWSDDPSCDKADHQQATKESSNGNHDKVAARFQHTCVDRVVRNQVTNRNHLLSGGPESRLNEVKQASSAREFMREHCRALGGKAGRDIILIK